MCDVHSPVQQLQGTQQMQYRETGLFFDHIHILYIDMAIAWSKNKNYKIKSPLWWYTHKLITGGTCMLLGTRYEPGKNKKAFKGHFICNKNDLIEIVLFPRGYFDHFLLAFIPKPKPYDSRGAKLFMHYSIKCPCQFKFRTRNSH